MDRGAGVAVGVADGPGVGVMVAVGVNDGVGEGVRVAWTGIGTGQTQRKTPCCSLVAIHYQEIGARFRLR